MNAITEIEETFILASEIAAELSTEVGLSVEQIQLKATQALEHLYNLPTGFLVLDSPDEFEHSTYKPKEINEDLVRTAMLMFSVGPWIYLAQQENSSQELKNRTGLPGIDYFMPKTEVNPADYHGITEAFMHQYHRYWGTGSTVNKNFVAIHQTLKSLFFNQVVCTDYVRGTIDELPQQYRDLNLKLFNPPDLGMQDFEDGYLWYTQKHHVSQEKLLITGNSEYNHMLAKYEDNLERINLEIFSMFPKEFKKGNWGQLGEMEPADIDKQRELYKTNFPFHLMVNAWNKNYRDMMIKFLAIPPEKQQSYDEFYLSEEDYEMQYFPQVDYNKMPSETDDDYAKFDFLESQGFEVDRFKRLFKFKFIWRDIDTFQFKMTSPNINDSYDIKKKYLESIGYIIGQAEFKDEFNMNEWHLSYKENEYDQWHKIDDYPWKGKETVPQFDLAGDDPESEYEENEPKDFHVGDFVKVHYYDSQVLGTIVSMTPNLQNYNIQLQSGDMYNNVDPEDIELYVKPPRPTKEERLAELLDSDDSSDDLYSNVTEYDKQYEQVPVVLPTAGGPEDYSYDESKPYYAQETEPAESIKSAVEFEEHIDKVIGTENVIANRSTLPIWALAICLTIYTATKFKRT